MILTTMCIAGVTTLTSVGLSYAMQFPKKDKVVYSKPEVTRVAKDQIELATAIVVDLRHSMKSKNLTAQTISNAFLGYKGIAATSWIISKSQLNKYKYHYLVEFVEPFLNTLHSATTLQGEDPTEEFTELLIEIIETTTPIAANFLLRGDTGERCSTEGIKLEKSTGYFSNRLKNCNEKKLAALTSMPKRDKDNMTMEEK